MENVRQPTLVSGRKDKVPPDRAKQQRNNALGTYPPAIEPHRGERPQRAGQDGLKQLRTMPISVRHDILQRTRPCSKSLRHRDKAGDQLLTQIEALQHLQVAVRVHALHVVQ